MFYVWLLVASYDTFRDTTFVLLLYYFYRFFIPVKVLKVLTSLFSKTPERRIVPARFR